MLPPRGVGQSELGRNPGYWRPGEIAGCEETTVLTGMGELCPALASTSRGRRPPGGRPGSTRAALSRSERRPGRSSCLGENPAAGRAGIRAEKSRRRRGASGGGRRRRRAKKRARPKSVLERRLSSVGAAGEPGSCAGPAGRARGGGGERQNRTRSLWGPATDRRGGAECQSAAIFLRRYFGGAREVCESKRKRTLLSPTSHSSPLFPLRPTSFSSHPL